MGMKGFCQCGAVQFETPTSKPTIVYVCYCLECRRQSSGMYGLSAMFPNFEFTDEAKANMQIYTRKTFRNEDKNCAFCKHCGSRIYHHCPGQKTINIRAGLLEGLSREMMDNAVHLWTKRALVPIPEGAKQYEEEPPFDTAREV